MKAAPAADLAQDGRDALIQKLAGIASVAESAEVAIIIETLDGTITAWSPGAEGLFGYSAPEAVGKSLRMLLPDDQPNAETDILAHIARGEKVEHFETTRIRKGGGPVEISVTISPILDGRGAIVGASKIAHDVTKAKANEREIRLLNEELENMVAARTAQVEAANAELRDRKFALDQHAIVATTDVQGTITYVNEKFCAISQYAKSELVGQNHRILNSGHHSKEFFRNMYHSIAAGRVWRDEICNRAKDGSCYWVDTTIVPLKGADGKPRQYLAIRTDVTGRRLAEEALRQNLTNQIRFKDEFLSHVSHELRSPLTAIKQFTNILLGGMAGAVNHEQREFLQIVLKNILQLQAMIDDLLEITHLESGKLHVHTETISIVEPLTDAFNTIRMSASAKRIDLSLDVPSWVPQVRADPVRVRQILIILLDNAVKFTPRGGAIRVRARPSPEDPEFLLSEISDTGRGMTAAEAEKVFERLHQVTDTDNDTPRKGLGLGLFICRELVTRQGGKMWVSTQPGLGSTFSFTLPIFSLSKLIAPLLQNDTLPLPESVFLITVQTAFPGEYLSRQFQEEWVREVRDLVGRCTMPNLDLLLPRMKYSAEGERFYIVAFADEQGVTVLSRRIEQQAKQLLLAKHAGLKLVVSHTRLNPFPQEGAGSKEEFAQMAVENLEKLIKSEIHSERKTS